MRILGLTKEEIDSDLRDFECDGVRESGFHFSRLVDEAAFLAGHPSPAYVTKTEARRAIAALFREDAEEV